MRIDVKKYLFYGVSSKRAEFFEKAQQEGVIEFIDTNPARQAETPVEIQHILKAIKILRGLPTTEQEETDNFDNAGQIAAEIVALCEQEDDLNETLRVLAQEIARVDVFGDFSTEQVQWIEREGKRKIQFFAAKRDVEIDEKAAENLIYVGADHGLDYYVGVHPEPVHIEGLLEMVIDEPYGALLKRRERARQDLAAVEKRLKTYAKYQTFLHEALSDRYNAFNLEATQDQVAYEVNEQIFVVEGWVPSNRYDEVEKFTQDLEVNFEEIAVEESDRVPTYLENSGYARIGEDLVHVYDTPGTEDKDPSMWVLWSFALFFGIILGDGGYGLLFLAGALYMRFKLKNPTPLLKRMTTLFTILSVSCVAWGVFTNSFFGISFDIDSVVRDVSGLQWMVEKKADYHFAAQDEVYQKWAERFPAVASASTGEEMLRFGVAERDGRLSYTVMDSFADGIMLELALLVGVIHVILSMLRSLGASWAGIGWIAFLIGGYLYVPEYLNATSLVQYVFGVDRAYGAEVGTELLYGGIGAAVVLALIQHRMGGLGEIVNLIQVFADVLSYLRLYALGLAGSMMSSTFNDIGGSITLVLGILVIMIGHAVNIVLSIMGGVIHGLRLNFLEWYHYCFEGGGKIFRPLALLKVRQ